MEKASTFIWLAIAGLIVCNGYVSYLLWKSRQYDGFQKKAQMVLIWAFPYLGALIVYLVMRPGKRYSNDPSQAQSENRDAATRWDT